MDRKQSIKTLLLGGFSFPFLKTLKSTDTKESNGIFALNTAVIDGHEMHSPWNKMPDMVWTGSAYWANRLQDWRIKDGYLECVHQGPNRTLYCLTHQLSNARQSFVSSIHLKLAETTSVSSENRIGFRLGAKGKFQDYRSAAIYGKGLDAGITSEGFLFIDNKMYSRSSIDKEQLSDGIILEVQAEPWGMDYALRLKVYDSSRENELASVEQTDVKDKNRNKISCRIQSWSIKGQKLDFNPDQTFGPIYFAQYTQQKNRLQLTAQFAPLQLPGSAFLEIKQDENWERVSTADIDYPSYTAQFKIDNWNHKKDISYRVGYKLPLTDDTSHTYFWEGTIAKEPLDKNQLKALVCSCNRDNGFPDQEIVDHASLHNADVIMFLGDQFYEPNCGFGVQRAPKEKAYLDYLRKWYQFGWSYREFFRYKPCICLPDDHDVFQANLFGAEGQKMPNKPGLLNRDWGGYNMPPEWVNMVMTTQTSHMPDPYDPEPIKQDIHVFYTDWKYAGVSFGIIEDRKFKSGPKQILPEEAKERDGFVLNEHYDITKHQYPDADLIGERQIDFLKDWIEDWNQETEFKVLVSATPFHSLQTLPDGPESNGKQPRLPIPEPSEYVKGDVPVADMDSGGWPQNKRDEVLKIIRKGFTIHLAGDQHLPAVTQYGMEDWQDSGIVFAVPALGNSWPRRWWPPIPETHEPLSGQPPYTGNFKDGFGNKMRVYAVANPQQTGLKPKNLYDRAPGYGIVTFDKKQRTCELECWPRYINPKVAPDQQFRGWPLTFHQRDNYNPSDIKHLPNINIKGVSKPIVKVINEETGELDHILRIRGNQYQPQVSMGDKYTVEIQETGSGYNKKLMGLEALPTNNEQQKVEF